uniref:Uncharacterized protein n=1 Tax=Rhipicephalus zambeziensis TaxID=60191 RepID=A0A224YGA1_9ACAR
MSYKDGVLEVSAGRSTGCPASPYLPSLVKHRVLQAGRPRCRSANLSSSCRCSLRRFSRWSPLGDNMRCQQDPECSIPGMNTAKVKQVLRVPAFSGTRVVATKISRKGNKSSGTQVIRKPVPGTFSQNACPVFCCGLCLSQVCVHKCARQGHCYIYHFINERCNVFIVYLNYLNV